MKENKTLILLGGNSGDTIQLFELAIERIQREIGMVVRESSIYESTPWGFESPHNFVNRVFELKTILSPELLLNRLLEVEHSLGRKREKSAVYEDRGIDIDILLYNNCVINTPHLIIPHPRFHLRKFALVPLCESWSDWVHPIYRKDIEQLLKACPDKGFVHRRD